MVNKLLINDTCLYAGTFRGVYLSTNIGLTWTAINTGLSYLDVLSLAVLNNNFFVSTEDPDIPTHPSGVFRSTNKGASWAPIPGIYAYTLIVVDSNLFAGGGPMYLSTDYGSTWTLKDSGLPELKTIFSFAATNGNIFIGADSGVFLSTNNGTNWTATSTGLPGRQITALAISNGNLLAGTWGAGIWIRPVFEMITSVNNIATDLPTHFNLDQNYPNPFNPTTTISFSVSSKSFISLKVFDVIGRIVANLASEELSPGKYNIQWNAINMSSGMYFYRLRAGSFSETKKCILIR